MHRNRLLLTALVLITFGMAGIFTTAWFAGPHIFGSGMSSRGGMMDQDRVKEMMQEMMSGRLPPGIAPEDLPKPDSPGAKLLNRYCTQCHNLPSPAMHTAEEWPDVEGHMISRMEMMSGMKGMMQGMIVLLH